MILTTLSNGRTIATIEGDTHIGKWVIESGRLDHDQNMLPLLAPLIPEGGTVIDVGAFIGDHTEFYANKVGPTGMVIAFEPNPEAFECLWHNMERYPNVICRSEGVSNNTDPIYIAKATNAGASHATTEETDAHLTCTTIDSLSIKDCHFIKMDCEGMEPLALHGARETIMTHRPTLLIEVNEGALARQGFNGETIFAILKHYGYKARNIYENQPMKGNQYDILCLPLSA